MTQGEAKRVEKRLFQSAHQALRFAYNFSDMQHGNAAAAERAIALQARERYLNPPGSGRGLIGPDGAAQAGMIQSLVGRQDALTQLVIRARFTELNDGERSAACRAVTLYARRRAPIPSELSARPEAIFQLVRRHFGAKVNMGRLADREDVHAATVRRWQVSLLKWLKPLELRCMHRLEVELERAKVVDAIK